ncbi:C1QL [Mytilus coruscus]|uniref:C1QL n=1 Tax=Mytilus coruscus TaxID=42192 RepID=A0A6J8A7C0_MYTCO|nr:C1QL [Mytilus coruscus]
MKLKELDNSQKELLHVFRNVEMNNNKLNEKVRRLSILVRRQCIPTSNIVAFTVVLDHEATLGPLQVVKYNKILTKVGNAYDPRHGHANIPIKGIYLVAVTSMNHNNEDMHIELVRNDDLQESLIMPAGKLLDSMSQTLVFSLEKSDLVWVRVNNHNSYNGHRLYGTSIDFFNTFSAILLFPL